MLNLQKGLWSMILVFGVVLFRERSVEGKEVTKSVLISGEKDEESALSPTKSLMVRLPSNYSVHQPPPLIDGQPVPVYFSILLFNVFDIKELQGDLSLEANLKIFWRDTRLANLTQNIEEEEKYVVLNPSLITQIWHPDAFIDHLKSMSQPSLISKAASLRIYPDGSLRYSARMLINLSCRMDFYYYPADTQRCDLDIKSYAYSTRHITLSWKDDKGPELAYPIEVHNFDVGLEKSENYLQNTRSASYSAIKFTIFLRRKLSYHIIQTYIPSALFTIVSWLSFLVPPESTPGRMAICVTTLLTLTAMFSAVRNSTPNVAYVKALDLWMVICIVFVFSVLAEYTTVLKLRSMKEKRKKDVVVVRGSNKENPTSVEVRSLSSGSSPQLTRRNNYALDFCDKNATSPLIASSRPMTPASPIPIADDDKKPTKYFILACKFEIYTPRIMPLVFLLFNFIYWPCLLVSSDYYKLRQDKEMYYSV